jgi:dTDP-4-amino-4,6-dideoxygalactose transaminase
VTCSGVLGSIQALGFVPKVVDSAPSSFNIDAEQVAARISEDVSCLLVTHAAGEPVDVPAIKRILENKSIVILEDCSQATGASIRGEKVGTWGDIAAFSTMYRKNLAAGASSGLIFTKDFETYRTALSYSDRGKPVWRLDLNLRDPQYASFPALNWNSSEMSNAIGLASLRRLDHTNELRRIFLRRLFVALAEADTVCSPYAFHDGFAPFYFPIFVDQEKIKVSVEQFATAVEAEGIPLGAKYGCLVNTWPWITEHLSDSFVARNALLTRNASFNLHLNENYGEREVKDIVEALAKVSATYSR